MRSGIFGAIIVLVSAAFYWEKQKPIDQKPAPSFPSTKVAKIPVEVPKKLAVKAPIRGAAPEPTISTLGFRERLNQLKACNESGTCPYPRTDPRSYDFALGQDLKKTLIEMAEDVEVNGSIQEEISATAREFLSWNDGHVQEAALDLISTQPPSPENLGAILNNILRGYDSELIEQALLELERYDSPGDLQKIEEAFAEAIKVGAPFVAREVSLHISPFLRPQSISFFQQLAGHLPPGSVSRANLEASLAAYWHQDQEG